ncbi:MAG: N-acetylneuraminate synthase [Dysgonamonadaceae bacterium]
MEKIFIIAEAGVNHNGSMDTALRMIDAAADAGADAIKFQTFKAEELVSSTARKADYQILNAPNGDESQLAMLQKLELTYSEYEQLIARCQVRNIKFFSTAFDLDSLEFLSEVGLPVVKIPSGEITNLPFLLKAAELFRRVYLSTGMSTIEEIGEALKVFTDAGIDKKDITILHCNTEYPTPMEDVNLRAMLHLQQVFGTRIGYSDHTRGIEVPIAAVALGAAVIEKHFTLDRTMAGPDHKASLEPQELKAMIAAIRNIEKALSGSGIKEVTPSEEKNKASARTSIVAKTTIKKGTPLTEENLTAKRPGTGMSPMKWNSVIGKTASKDYKRDEMIDEKIE